MMKYLVETIGRLSGEGSSQVELSDVERLLGGLALAYEALWNLYLQLLIADSVVVALVVDVHVGVDGGQLLLVSGKGEASSAVSGSLVEELVQN